MTDEELHRLEIRYSDMESWDDAKRLVDECVRLRAENRKLVERVKDHCEWLSARGHYPVAEELLRAAIEGK